MVASSAAGMSPPPLRAIGKEAWGTFVYGTERPLVQWFAYALAIACDPEPLWVDFRGGSATADASGPIALGKIPPHHLYVISRSEARPLPTVPDRTLWTMIRSDEPKESLLEFSDFLRLPPQVQEVLAARGEAAPRPAIVLANTDRVRDYYPHTIDGIRPFVLTALRANVLPILASSPPKAPAYLAFDHVFEVRARSLSDWRDGILSCEQAPAGSDFVPRRTFRLSSIPELVSLLDLRSA